jgi:hypothetical protein
MGMRSMTKPVRRPKKSRKDRVRREAVQRKRLIGLGVAESTVKKLNAEQVRTLLKRPAKLQKPRA